MNFKIDLTGLPDNIRESYMAHPWIPQWGNIMRDSSLSLEEKTLLNGFVAMAAPNKSVVINWTSFLGDLDERKKEIANKNLLYAMTLLCAKQRIKTSRTGDSVTIVLFDPDASQFPSTAKIIKQTMENHGQGAS